MLWIQIVIFLLVAGGTMTLLNVNFKDFFQLAARGKPSTLKDWIFSGSACFRSLQQPVFNPSTRRGICFCTGLVFALYRHDL